MPRLGWPIEALITPPPSPSPPTMQTIIPRQAVRSRRRLPLTSSYIVLPAVATVAVPRPAIRLWLPRPRALPPLRPLLTSVQALATLAGPPPWDLFDAAIAWLRATPAVTTLATGGLHAGYAGPGPKVMPYVEVYEPNESDSFDSAGQVARGSLQLNVYAGSRPELRALSAALMAALQDAPLVFVSGTLLYLRPAGRSFQKETDPAPGGVACYQEVRMFTYIVDGSA